MQIACPNCKTHYQIEPASLGPTGRSARCVRCKHVWFARPPAPITEPPKLAASPEKNENDEAVAAFSSELGPPALEPSPAAPPAAQQSAKNTPAEPSADPEAATIDSNAAPPIVPDQADPVALSDIAIPVQDSPPLVPAPGDGAHQPGATATGNGPRDIESVAARRTKARNRNRIRLPLAIVVLGLIAGTLVGLRKDVVRHVPQLASFYSAIGLPVNIRGVAFTDLKIGNEIQDGVPVLVIEGAIVSMTSKPIDVPRLRFALRNASGAEIYSWTTQPSQPVLEPFDSMTFRSRLAAPPVDGHDVQVRFFTRSDVPASR